MVSAIGSDASTITFNPNAETHGARAIKQAGGAGIQSVFSNALRFASTVSRNAENDDINQMSSDLAVIGGETIEEEAKNKILKRYKAENIEQATENIQKGMTAKYENIKWHSALLMDAQGVSDANRNIKRMSIDADTTIDAKTKEIQETAEDVEDEDDRAWGDVDLSKDNVSKEEINEALGKLMLENVTLEQESVNQAKDRTFGQALEMEGWYGASSMYAQQDIKEKQDKLKDKLAQPALSSAINNMSIQEVNALAQTVEDVSGVPAESIAISIKTMQATSRTHKLVNEAEMISGKVSKNAMVRKQAVVHKLKAELKTGNITDPIVITKAKSSIYKLEYSQRQYQQAIINNI